MKILWVCNKKPTKVSELRSELVNSFGGWIDSTCRSLLKRRDCSLCILFPDIHEYEGEEGQFSFYSFSKNNCTNRIEKAMQDFSPEIIHCWGTEYSHTNECLKICERLGCIEKCVISIQGLVSLYGKYHYTEGLPFKIIYRYTLRDFIKRMNIEKERNKFIERGEIEVESLKRARYIIGRTDFDNAAVQKFNQKATYYSCNESLRSSFYNTKWSIDSIERNSIFVSQCSYPIKGFHYLLEALPDIIKKYPDTHVYTTGIDLLHLSLQQKMRLSSYRKYLIELINKYNLESHISFLGILSEEEMCRQYQKAHVFVSPSTIENSPNSVGEAMLVGCPVVSSDVGGVKNMLEHGKEGFIYQSSAPYMLAYYVNKIFESDRLAVELSDCAKKHAKLTHDRDINTTQLYTIYKRILKQHIEINNNFYNSGGGGNL